MKEISLVIMAAGLGSRYKGGIKQLEAVGPDGKIIMEYSILDAINAGFNKVVFIIRKDIEEYFKKLIGSKFEDKIKCEYVYQELDNLPDGFSKKDRIKPWGTGHAILVASEVIKGPFLVINADDYYGKEAYQKIYDFLSTVDINSYNFCMAGFILKNTLSANGGVNRGVCKIDGNNNLIGVVETHDIKANGNIASSDLGELSLDSYVSMNMWGFTPKILDELKEGFTSFLSNLNEDDIKSEYLLPDIIDKLIKEKKANVKLLKTNDIWHGITYHEDLDSVKQAFLELYDKGIYKI